ncbi:hypothetical protein [Thalassotalea atypica]|uniref:hypothetical protein n=1 Tax=Thalassotalea atypica TaxID=2054316 RepID=UPI002574341F|nr:hypothetical protein [Thalassotalea atypica]
MEATSLNKGLVERRHADVDRRALMSRLSVSQKFAVKSLNQFGYEIEFIRSKNQDSFAVLMNGENLAVVDMQGEIDTSPNISIR